MKPVDGAVGINSSEPAHKLRLGHCRATCFKAVCETDVLKKTEQQQQTNVRFLTVFYSPVMMSLTPTLYCNHSGGIFDSNSGQQFAEILPLVGQIQVGELKSEAVMGTIACAFTHCTSRVIFIPTPGCTFSQPGKQFYVQLSIR